MIGCDNLEVSKSVWVNLLNQEELTDLDSQVEDIQWDS